MANQINHRLHQPHLVSPINHQASKKSSMLISRTTNHALHKHHTRQRARHQIDSTHRPSAIATAYTHEFKHPNGCKAVADTSTKRVLWYGGTTKPDDTGQPGRTSRSHKQSPPSCISTLARMPRHLIPRANEIRSPPTPNLQKRPARCIGRRRRVGGKKPYSFTAYEKQGKHSRRLQKAVHCDREALPAPRPKRELRLWRRMQGLQDL
jgi:hypothetical protein